jgi:signal peptidase II
MRRQSIEVGLVSLIGALTADRLFKHLVWWRLNANLPDIETRLLRIGYYSNAGVGLGIRLPVWLIVGLSAVIIIGLVVWLAKRYAKISTITRWAIGLIIVGAVSNLYDRIFYGHVIDVINIFDWSVFNPADVWIVAGVFIVLVEMMSKKKTTTKT